MKILIISSCYPRPNARNHGIFVHQQMKSLAALGVEVHVIQPVGWYPPFGLHRLHPYWRTGFTQHKNTFDEFEGIKIHHPKIFTAMPSRFFLEDPWNREGRQVAEYILKYSELNNADLIYAQFLIHEGYVGTIVKERTGIPLVSIALGDDVHAWPEAHPQNIPKLQEVLYKSDLVLANSSRLAKDTEQWAYSDKRIDVKCAYQGIDLDKFQPVNNEATRLKRKNVFKLEADKKHLLCIATPVVLKGWMELLDSIAVLKDELVDWNLVIVAPPRKAPDALDLGEEVRKRNIENHVTYLGAVDPAEMHYLMQAVDAFILPSYNEGLSNAVLEAMASGLPTITTNVGGHSEVIIHGENGYLIAPRNTKDIINALREVLLNDLYRIDLSKKARTGVKKVGTYDDNAKVLLSIFNKMIHGE
jgi:teichuronic acid biosynthesis glycosyltransferase TuaC